MINATYRLEAVKHNSFNGITWMKLLGDPGFDWILEDHPDTPEGFVCIGGLFNGSRIIIQKEIFEEAREEK